MKLDFFMTGSDKVVDDMGRFAVDASSAEPLVAAQALDDGVGRVNSAVSVSSNQYVLQMPLPRDVWLPTRKHGQEDLVPPPA
jgi:hypothetical protein